MDDLRAVVWAFYGGQQGTRAVADILTGPLFAFGHGLSYTTFSYGELALGPAEVPVDGTVTVSVPVTNTGERAGDEVVQLYFRDTATGLPRPAQELVGFQRIQLAPGATVTVEFTVPLSQLGYLGLDGTLILEPGPVEVHAAASDDISSRGQFEVTWRHDHPGRPPHLSLRGGDNPAVIRTVCSARSPPSQTPPERKIP